MQGLLTRGIEYIRGLDRTRMRRIGSIVLSALLLTLAAVTVIRFILGPSEGYYTSDCTDTLFWAWASYESGQLISTDFAYAAILPFGGNLFMLLFVPFFGFSMKTQLAGMVLFFILFAAAILFFCRSIGQGWIFSSATVFVSCLVLSSSEKLLEIMWEHIIYYSLGILFFCVGLGLLFRVSAAFREGNRKRLLVFASLLFAFTVISAANGLITLVSWILPAIFGLLMVWVFDESERGFSRNTRFTVLKIAALAFATGLGLLLLRLVSNGVSAGYADAYSGYDTMGNWTDNLLGLPVNWLKLLGVSVKGGEALVSADGIVQMIRIFGGLLLPVMPYFAFFAYRKLSRPVRITVFAHLAVSAFLLYSSIFGRLGLANWRLVPMLGTALLASSAVLWDLLRSAPRISLRRIAVLLLIVPCLMAAISFRELAAMPSDYGRDSDAHLAAEELTERGLTKGYATFWNSQLITLLSDNLTEVRTVEIVTADHGKAPAKRYYQTSYDWYDDSEEEKTFLLLDLREYMEIAAWRTQNSEQILEVFEIGRYTVIVFDGAIPLG